jgi:hypothetical protein
VERCFDVSAAATAIVGNPSRDVWALLGATANSGQFRIRSSANGRLDLVEEVTLPYLSRCELGRIILYQQAAEGAGMMD